MRFRGSFTLAAVSVAGFAALASCSDASSDPVSDPIDASDADHTRPPSDDGGQEASPGSCVGGCERAHPEGLTKELTLSACVTAHCNTACSTPARDAGDAGDASDASDGDDAGDDDDGGPTCRNDVVAQSGACNRCIRESCCAAWDGCFDNVDCAKLQDCYAACPSIGP